MEWKGSFEGSNCFPRCFRAVLGNKLRILRATSRTTNLRFSNRRRVRLLNKRYASHTTSNRYFQRSNLGYHNLHSILGAHKLRVQKRADRHHKSENQITKTAADHFLFFYIQICCYILNELFLLRKLQSAL
jgi:hypothetical protein